MHIVEITVAFQLPGCNALKEKRRRLRPLADRFGRNTHTAVCESDFHDQRGRAEWRFVIVGNSMAVIQAQCQHIEDYCHQLDAYVTRLERDILC